jgi:hypothetical protein
MLSSFIDDMGNLYSQIMDRLYVSPEHSENVAHKRLCLDKSKSIFISIYEPVDTKISSQVLEIGHLRYVLYCYEHDTIMQMYRYTFHHSNLSSSSIASLSFYHNATTIMMYLSTTDNVISITKLIEKKDGLEPFKFQNKSFEFDEFLNCIEKIDY